jgi:uncharacterized coiled-coil DUF342 family protein
MSDIDRVKEIELLWGDRERWLDVLGVHAQEPHQHVGELIEIVERLRETNIAIHSRFDELMKQSINWSELASIQRDDIANLKNEIDSLRKERDDARSELSWIRNPEIHG